ncbi:MAG TPA: hypothetical protein VIH21_02035 [Dehalococcoidia bacterium]
MFLNMKIAAMAAAAIIVSGAAVGIVTGVRAQEGGDQPKPTRQERREAFVGRVAGHLGVTSDQLTDAVKQARLDGVDAALANGRINEDQAAKLRERIESGKGFGGLGHRGERYERRMKVRHALVESAAGALNMSADDLRAELKSGKSVADVAAEKNVPLDDVKSGITADAKAKLDAAVANQRLTQERADALLAKLTDNLDELLNKKRATPAE